MDHEKSTDFLQGSSSNQYSEDEIDLLGIVGSLLDNRWTIVTTTAVATLLSIGIAVISSPIYRAGGLLQVEEKSASLPGLEDLAEAFNSESSTQAELQIIKSRSVIGATVENLGLTTVVTPSYFPYFGDFLARRFRVTKETQFREPVFRLDNYAWGGEAISVDRLEVDSSLRGEALTLIAGHDGTFDIVTQSGRSLAGGAAGKITESDQLTIFVSELIARPGTEFIITKRPWLRAVKRIQRNLSVTEVGRQTGIIKLSYSDQDPKLAEAIVNEVARVYVNLNISRLSAEAENSLEFMREQIPYIQRDLQNAEATFNKFASENQSIDVSAENQAVLTQLVELDTRIQELELERVELNRRFTKNHPNVIAAAEQYRQLNAERERFNRRIEALPDTQQKLVSLRRDVEVASGIYELLLYKAQEMEVARASTVGNVRIIDTAIADRSAPIAPKKSLIVALGAILGGITSILLVLIRRAVYRGVESSEEIESVGLSVFASIPFSDEQKRWDEIFNDGKKAHKGRKGLKILSKEEPTDLAVEMLRNLRTSLYFNLAEAPNKAVMVSGPSPSVGKSFISVNLATICALAGQKVLLVDADMRRGYLHRYVSKTNKDGLADYLSGQKALDDLIFNTGIENLDLISRGKTPPNPSELLHHKRLEELIDTCGEKYDLILFDTPPVLAVTDAAIVGQAVGNSLLICRFDKTSKREIEHAKSRLVRDGATVTGAVLNGVEKRLS
ncbi:MAG: hypothetical protein CBB97_23585, partial [Candidatus Endolissoclinum sp. TMED37]